MQCLSCHVCDGLIFSLAGGRSGVLTLYLREEGGTPLVLYSTVGPPRVSTAFKVPAQDTSNTQNHHDARAEVDGRQS